MPQSEDERHRRPRRLPPLRTDLEVLTSEPSLASLRTEGWRLDRLPTTSTAWAFVASLAAATLTFGPDGAAVVLTFSVLAVLLAGLGLLTRDLLAVRWTLRVARVGLLVSAVGVVLLARGPLLSVAGDAPSPHSAVDVPAAPQFVIGTP